METFDVLSLIVTILGVSFGIMQYFRNLKTKSLLKNQFISILDRVRTLVPFQDKLDEMLKKCDDKEINKWVWFNHKGLSDLYVMTVSYYLTFERRFTYKHLKNKFDNHQLSSRWEENRWRYLISARKENKNLIHPDYFTKGKKNIKSKKSGK